MGKSVLIVGNSGGAGGREHAFGEALAASPSVSEVYFIPGNGGTASCGTNLDIAPDGITDWAVENAVDLVVIGPEAPLVEGLADKLRSRGLAVCGPSKTAAQLEGSKSFAFNFMEDSSIAQPPSKVVSSEAEGLEAMEEMGGPKDAVIKADGLAGGKGVFLPDDAASAKRALSRIFAGEIDKSGTSVVIQKRLSGPEVSVFLLSDGVEFYIIPVAAQDHKRLLDDDKGPNTGGMGAYAPVPESILSKHQWKQVAVVAEKTIKGMAGRGTPYQGILYMGLMLAEELDGDPVVIEYNVRFGDPEAQVLIPLLARAGVDIYSLLESSSRPSGLAGMSLPHKLNETALSVVIAAHGYPESARKGDIIGGLDKSYKDVRVYHAGTKADNGNVVTSGGRVLNVTGSGKDIAGARQAAYAAIGGSGIHFDGMQYRRDIGHQALQSEE